MRTRVGNVNPPQRLVRHAQSRRNLMLEVSKRVTKILFENPNMDGPISQTYDDISDAIMKVLPEALVATGAVSFNIKSLTKEKDWHHLCCMYIEGVLVSMPDKVRRAGPKATWKIRTGKPGKVNGKWKYCSWCGGPFYTSKSKCRQRYDSPTCYWAAYRTKSVAETPDFANVAAF